MSEYTFDVGRQTWLDAVVAGLAELSTMPVDPDWFKRALEVEDLFYRTVFVASISWKIQRVADVYVRWSGGFGTELKRNYPSVIDELIDLRGKECFRVELGKPVRVPIRWQGRRNIVVRNPEPVFGTSGLTLKRDLKYAYGDRCVLGQGRVMPLGQEDRNILVRYEREVEEAGCPTGTLFFITTYEYPAFVGATEEFGVPSTPEERERTEKSLRQNVQSILGTQHWK